MGSKYDIFCAYHGKAFTRFASALERSIQHNCPDARFIGKEISPPPQINNLPRNGTNNLRKLTAWQQFGEQARRPFILMDADMMVCRDVAPVWTRDFDIGYCIRPHRCPIIGGFIPCRPTAAMRRFMRRWVCEVANLALQPTLAKRKMSEYGGLLQSGLNRLREIEVRGLSVEELDASVWNCCDQVWHTFDPNITRVMHLKGRLRQVAKRARVPREPDVNADLAPIVEEWLRYHMGNL